MLINRFFHGNRAGHGATMAKQRARRPQRESRDMPEGQQGCWAHAAFANQARECVQMDLFLRLHMFDQRAVFGAAQHG